jgi:hypothetical protein
MLKRIELGATAKGSLGEDRDWWTLVIDDAGKTYVEHEWSHRNAYKFRVGSTGRKLIAVDYFLDGDYNSATQQRLREELAHSKGTT